MQISTDTNMYEKSNLITELASTKVGDSSININSLRGISEKLKSANTNVADSRYDVILNQGNVDMKVVANNTLDYMTVMSHSMSATDYSRMCAEGNNPEYVSPEEYITILDRIKAELAMSGVSVDGYNDDIDIDKLESITGSRVMANEIASSIKKIDIPSTQNNIEEIYNASEIASKLEEPSNGTIAHMLINNIDATIVGLYTASHAKAVDGVDNYPMFYRGDSGYISVKADSKNYQELRSQIERVLEEAGIDINEGSIRDAHWIIDRDIPLTPDSIRRLENIKSVEYPVNLSLAINRATTSIAQGQEAMVANLGSDYKSIHERAYSVIEVIDTSLDKLVGIGLGKNNSITDGIEAVDKSVMTESALNSGGDAYEYNTVRRIEEAISRWISPEETIRDISNIYATDKQLTWINQIEQVRSHMKIEFNIELIKQGYEIENIRLTELDTLLSDIQYKMGARLFGNYTEDVVSSKWNIYENSNKIIAEVGKLPASLVGSIGRRNSTYSLNDIHDIGIKAAKRYQEANLAYETLATKPDKSLGDSYTKAFGNIESLLKALNLTNNDMNQRAIRILGYNGINITVENIENAKVVYQDIMNVTDRMKPSVVLNMIRDGINPLEESMEFIRDYLDNLDKDIVSESNRYAHFLHSLDNTQAITSDEREAYIGIYRLLNKIENSNEAIIGSLINQGRNISFGSMLSEIRTRKHGSIDVRLDDEFGGLKELISENLPIDEQINRGYYEKSLANSIINNMIKGECPNITTSIMNANIRDALELLIDNHGDNGEDNIDYYKDMAHEIVSGMPKNDEHIKTVLNMIDSDVTIGNISIANQLLLNRGEIYRKLRRFGFEVDVNQIERMGDEEASLTEYDSLKKETEELLTDAINNSELRYEDIRQLTIISQQINMSFNLARRRVYEVPVEIDGELTSINLSINTDSTEKGKISIYLEAKRYGRLSGEFVRRDNILEGLIATDSRMAIEQLTNLEEVLRREIEREYEIDVGITVIYSKEVAKKLYKAYGNNEENNISTKELYGISQILVGTLIKEDV